MFKINYVFKKRGSEYQCSYPRKEHESNNIFIIKGKNDQGKSTLMQMIALGFHGLESNDIEKPLKDKMRRLTSKDAECKLNFIITSSDDKTKIEVGVDDGKVDIKVNGKTKPRTYIEDNFKIIFDTPAEPTKKLGSALILLRSNLDHYTDIVRRYSESINDKRNDIASYEDYESTLNTRKKNLEEERQTLENLKKRRGKKISDLNQSYNAYVFNIFNETEEKIKKLENQEVNIKNRIRELKSLGIGGGNKDYNNLLDEFIGVRSNIVFHLGMLKKHEKIMHNDYKKFETINNDINSIIIPKNLSDEKLKTWYKFFDDMRKNVESNPIYTKKTQEEDLIEIYEKIIPILKDFIDCNAEIPGTGGKNVSEFLSGLEDAQKELTKKSAEKIALKDVSEFCRNIIKGLSDFVAIQKRNPNIETTDADDYNSLIKRKDKIKNELPNLIKILIDKEDDYKAIPISERTTLSKTSNVVLEDYEEAKKEKDKLDTKISDTELSINILDKQISEDKNKREKFKMYYDKNKLEEFDKITISIMKKITSWKEIIASINPETMEIEDKNDNADEFCTALAEYFALILKKVYFENKEWKVRKVDFIKRCYDVDGREPIDFVDMGTGHTGLNSLLARLRQDCGNKKKIVLFDEIGLMDKDNRERLLSEIKTQTKSGKTIFALLTDVDDNLDRVMLDPVEVN